MLKRFLALLLTFSMVLSLCPMPARATEMEEEPYSVETELNGEAENSSAAETTTPVTEPDVTDPEETEPPQTESVEPEETESVEPEETESVEPEETESAVTEPDETEPDGTASAETVPEETEAAEDPIPLETHSVVYINPIYADSFTEEDLVQPSNVPMPADAVTYYASPEEAGMSMIPQMLARTATVSVTVQQSSYIGENNPVVDMIWDAALVHNGIPTQGDYLRWNMLGYNCSYGGYIQNGLFYVTYTYTITYHSTASQEAQVDTVVESIVSGLSGLSDYEKVCEIYDYLTHNVVYDDSLEDHSTYGALVEHCCVCQGYASAFYRLALEAGLDARIISGIGNGGAHGWNIVELNGNYYNLDATWDASYYQAGRNYAYFLKCDATFDDHARDEEFTTETFYANYPMAAVDYDPNDAPSGSEEEEPTEPALEYPVLPLGSTEVTIADGTTITYYQFTPETTGCYIVESFASSDTYCYLYDRNLNRLDYNDDGGDNNNFKMTSCLTGGETYVYGFRFYSNSTGSFTVNFSEAQKPESISLPADEMTLFWDGSDSSYAINVAMEPEDAYDQLTWKAPIRR